MNSGMKSFVLALAVPVFALAADDIAGKCIAVSDGDTITVLVNKRQVKIRLEGIDCPESHQDYGTKAKQFTAAAVFGKDVTVKVSTVDRYGRSVGTVFIGSLNVNLAIVEAGLAWHYKAYSSDKTLAEAESKARTARAGLWAQDDPTAPWDFRRGKTTSGRAAVTDPATDPAAEQPSGFWLNASSGVRHNENCKHYRRTKRGRPCTKQEGKACGICGG